MSATEAWLNIAKVLCQCKQNFESCSVFDDAMFLYGTL